MKKSAIAPNTIVMNEAEFVRFMANKATYKHGVGSYCQPGTPEVHTSRTGKFNNIAFFQSFVIEAKHKLKPYPYHGYKGCYSLTTTTGKPVFAFRGGLKRWQVSVVERKNGNTYYVTKKA